MKPVKDTKLKDWLGAGSDGKYGKWQGSGVTVHIELTKNIHGRAALNVKVVPRWPRSRQAIEDHELSIQRPDARLGLPLRGEFLKLEDGAKDAILEMYEDEYDDGRKIKALRYRYPATKLLNGQHLIASADLYLYANNL